MPSGNDGETLQKPRARRQHGLAQVDFRLPFLRRAVGGVVLLAHRLEFPGSGANCSLISSQQSRRCSGVALTYQPATPLRAARPPRR